MRRKTAKHLRQEIQEINYYDKLSPEEKSWLCQFLFEYYQADFNYLEPIHPEELRKDCRDRNNASKRQIHSVGANLLWEAARRALDIQNGSDNAQKARFYTHLDYGKQVVEYTEEEE